MRHLRRAFILLSVVCAVAVSETPERSGFTITRCDLHVMLHTVDSASDVDGTLTLRNDGTSSLSQVFLQLTSTAEWASISRNGSPLTYTVHKVKSDADHTGQMNEARIVLDRPLGRHSTLDLKVKYSLRALHESPRLLALGAPKEVALKTDWDRISPAFTGVRGAGYVAWYPMAIEPADMLQGATAFRAVESWKAREAQSDFSLEIEDAARKSTKSFSPLGLTVPVLTSVTPPVLTRNSVAVSAESVADAEPLQFSNAAESFAEDWLPARTAVAKLWVLPEQGDLPFTSGTEAFVPIGSEPFIANEIALYAVAHAALRSPRPWMQEGYPAFLVMMQRQREKGRAASLRMLQDKIQALAIDEPDNLDTADTSLINSAEQSRYQIKAALVWWMLRDLVGDAALQRAIKAYRYEDDRAPDYLQKLVEAAAHKDLNWFFTDWVYRDRGLPEFTITTAVPRQLVGGGWATEVKVKNSGGAGALVPVFLQAGDEEIRKTLLVPAHDSASVQFTTALKPRLARVNDGTVPETDTNDNQLEIK